MPVTAGRRSEEISQRAQYALGGIGRWFWDQRDRVALGFVTGQRVLDAGCGEGITLERLVRERPGAQIVGVDVDSANVEICRSHRLPVLRGSAFALPFPDGSFDACLLSEVIEHLEEPERAIAEIARVTRPGGRLVVVFPVDWAYWLARVLCLRWREARFDPGHVRQWSARELGALFRQHGFETVAVKRLPLPWPGTLSVVAVGERLSSS